MKQLISFPARQPLRPGKERRINRSACLLVAVLVAVGVVGVVPGPALASPPEVYVNMPFDGWYDRYGVSHPSQHHTPFGGDAGTDVYAPAGTAARLKAWPSAGSLQLVVEEVSSTCPSGDPNQGGWTVRVAVNVDTGGGMERAGWAAIGHLTEDPPLDVGQVIDQNTILGYTAQWPYSDCYQVSNADGVHHHIEIYSEDPNWGCWDPVQSGTFQSIDTRIFEIGPTGATGPRQQCP